MVLNKYKFFTKFFFYLIISALTNRRRLYIGPTIKNLIEPPSILYRPTTNTTNLNSSNGSTTNSIGSTTNSIVSIIDTNNDLGYNDNETTISIDETHSPSSIRLVNQFRRNLLRSLRNRNHISEYDNINIQLDDLESSTDLLFYWGMEASIIDLLKNPVIILLNEE